MESFIPSFVKVIRHKRKAKFTRYSLCIPFILMPFLYFITTDKVYCQSSVKIADATQDTLNGDRLKYLMEPDTIHYQYINTEHDSKSGSAFSGYIDFLIKISDTSRYKIVQIDEFNDTFAPDKIIIGLRHDVDLDLNTAYELSKAEYNFGIQSVYYILHTASYYLAKSDNYSLHNESIIPTLKTMQDEYNHRIGWHNDLVTLQLVHDIDPVAFLHQELDWLRSKGLSIMGTASHGSQYCYTYKYLNYYFFEEYKNPAVGQFLNNDSALVNGKWIKIKHAHLRDFGFDYEAYFLNNNKYYSDASFVDNIRWNVSMLDLESLMPGDRVIILIHPVYYHSSGSTLSEINSFSIPGQLRSMINSGDNVIQVEMPTGTNKKDLRAAFSVSPNARAMLGLKQLYSNQNSIDFTDPVNIKVIAENGLTYKNWMVEVIISEDSPTVGIDEMSDSPVPVYPNPAHSVLYLKEPVQNVAVSIFDLNGRIYINNRTVSNIVDISSLKKGIYIIRISNNGKNEWVKFVKE
jgi:hypothetical protein